MNKEYFCNGLPSFAALQAADPHFIDASTVLPANFADALLNNVPGTNLVQFLDQTPKLRHTGLIRDVLRGSFQGDYTFASGGHVAYNLGYNQSKATYAFDIDHSNLNRFLNAFAAIDRDFTADVRVSSNASKRLRVLVGASYFHSRNASDRIDDNIAFGGTPARSTLFVDAYNTTPAVYGSVDFDLLPSLTISGDARYEKEIDYNIDKVGVRYQQQFKNFLPRGIVKFHPTPDLDIYFSYSKGVQPATLNTSFILATPPQQAFIQSIQPDQNVFSPQPSSENYEVGIKQKALHGRLNYSLAVYQIDWHKALQSSFISNPPACNTVPPITNTTACPLGLNGTSLLLPNEARIRGIEFAASLRVSPEFDLALSLDYKDAKWRTFYNATFANAAFTGTNLATGVKYFNGNHLARIPNLTGVFSPSYHHALGNGSTIFARGDAIYTGKAWDSDLNIFQLPAFVRVNARIGIELHNATIELFSTNLFGDKHFDNGAIVADVNENSFQQRGLLVNTPPPREFGLRVQLKYR